MTGTFVALVGPSGVGKDSLLAFARARLEPTGRVLSVRRVVTREADCNSEDHDSMSVADFAAAADKGQFALSWEAHGLCYGLLAALEADLAEGRAVVANLSRAVIPAVMARFPNALVVSVTADRDVLEQRLAARGRETAQSIGERLDRSVGDTLPASTVQIDNSGALEEAGEQFVALLQDVAGLVKA